MSRGTAAGARGGVLAGMTAHQHIGDPGDGILREGVELEVPELELELERAGLPRRGVLAPEKALRRKVPHTRPAVASPQLAGDLPALHYTSGLAYRLPLGLTGLVRDQAAASREHEHKRRARERKMSRHLRFVNDQTMTWAVTRGASKLFWSTEKYALPG